MAEIIMCPNCQRQLRVPEQYLGQTVQCPECRHQFVAASAAVSTQPTPATATPPMKSKPRRYDDEDEAPRRRYEDDDEGDDYDDLDIHRRRGLRTRFDPHRGGLIMALGLIALVGGMSFCGVPALLGPVAWILGSMDLRAIRDGHMDPAGESMTRAGQVCGIVATVLLLLGSAFFCLMFLSEMN